MPLFSKHKKRVRDKDLLLKLERIILECAGVEQLKEFEIVKN